MTQSGLSRALTIGLACGLVLAGATAAVAVDGADRLEDEVRVVDPDGPQVLLSEVDDNRPLRLDPDREVDLALQIENPQGEQVVVRTVRVEGRVLGMTFFDYATRVNLPVPPEGTSTSLQLDISELGEQATGLLPARITLIGEDRQVLYEDAFPVEVEGSLWSTYGVFGLLVAAVTLVLLFAALVRLAVGALPRHRWLRASRFAVPGLGLGLTLTFTLSVLDVLVPSADSWVAILVGGGLLGLLAGFATPSPDARRRRDREAELASEETTPDELTTYPDDTAAPQESERDEDRVIVLPDDASPLPPLPRGPGDADDGGGADAPLPPRPTRRG